MASDRKGIKFDGVYGKVDETLPLVGVKMEYSPKCLRLAKRALKAKG